MQAWFIRYSNGPLQGKFKEKELRIGPGFRMSIGHGKERTFRLPRHEEVSEHHAAITNKGTASKLDLHIVPGEGRTRLWVPGTQYYETLPKTGRPLADGMKVRIGPHEFQIRRRTNNPTPVPSKANAPIHPIVQELIHIHRFMRQVAKGKRDVPKTVLPPQKARSEVQIIIPDSRLKKITIMMDREKITYRHETLQLVSHSDRRYCVIRVQTGRQQNKRFVSSMDTHREKFR